ncbi:hypothetical protein [Paenibacillus alvei]|uniref:hypothetical protein n=1 Tax=Paenibacillus alvei TaxID=44250 RepID=UPI0019D608A0|nr:hypothetical protein [Paenibacillus alvei]
MSKLQPPVEASTKYGLGGLSIPERSFLLIPFIWNIATITIYIVHARTYVQKSTLVLLSYLVTRATTPFTADA